MSRSIIIEYKDRGSGVVTRIDVQPPYDLLGGQSSSLQFWSIPRLRELGITQLTDLGLSDPIYFIGWDQLDVLWQEIRLLQEHLASIEFDAWSKTMWISNLVYCYFMLVQTAPTESLPCFEIG